jgi:hypothetical protein
VTKIRTTIHTKHFLEGTVLDAKVSKTGALVTFLGEQVVLYPWEFTTNI